MTQTLERLSLGEEAEALFDAYKGRVGDFSRVEDLEVEFPYLSQDLKRDFGARGLYLFRADDNEAGTFKVRGALMGAHKLQQQGATRLRLASAGNHARGAVVAARELGFHDVSIGVPANAPKEKREGLTKLWSPSHVRVHPIGSTFDDSLEFINLHPEFGELLPAFDDPNIIAGQGTVGRKILREAPEVKHLVSPVGGVGLVASMLQETEELGRTDITVHAVEIAGRNNGLSRSLETGIVTKPDRLDPEFAGSAVKHIGQHTLKICQNNRDRLVVHRVDPQEVAFTMAQYQQGRRDLLRTSFPGYEPTTLVALAGLRAIARDHGPEPIVIIGTGHNAPLPTYI